MPPPETTAAELFASYLAQRESGRAPGFEEWVAEHPEQASELRRLWERDRKLDDLLPTARDGSESVTGSFLSAT